MAFCGQCGLLLPSQATTCPRCGAEVIPNWAADGQEPDNLTAISLRNSPQQGTGSSLPQPVLPSSPMQPAGSSDYSRSTEWDPATSPPSASTLYPGYSTSSTSFPGAIPPNGAHYPPSPGFVPSANPGYPSNPPLPARKTSKGGIVLAVVLVSLLIVAATAFLVLQPTTVLNILRGNIQPTSTTQVTPTTPTPTPTPVPQQQARAVVEQYYADINKKDYHPAYNLWVNYPQDYDTFMQGFAHTAHDDIMIGAITAQNDGSFHINLTLVATTDTGQQNTFQGYYLVGQQPDGTWKIITAILH